jgi:threonine dehydrogenase-like Zn-dependent dehydrogenase
MKAIAVIPGKSGSVHLAEMPRPSVSEIAAGRGVLVKVLRVGVDGTDKEINAAEYGAAPAGFDFLVIGHESFGRVEEVGPNSARAIMWWPPCGVPDRASTIKSATQT